MSRPVAVITGGARGIGLEAARRLGSTHRVALLDLDGDGAHRAAAGLGGDAIAVQCDITDESSVTAAVEQVVAEAGGIDVCISNAGILTAGALRLLDPEVVAAQVNVNLVGNWRFVHACLPHVIARRGYVLGVASAAALAPTGGLGAYCASKAGFEMLLNCLRIEVAHLGVDVGVAYFAFVDSEMVRGTDLQHPGFNRMREAAPGPFGKTIPVSRAGAVIARGVKRRSPVVVAPRFVGPLRRLRGMVPGAIERGNRRMAPEVDAFTAEMVAQRGTFGGGLRPGDAGAAAAARSVTGEASR
ncbi:MAG: SDR family NAD(P)-dependent oxidoreductase [Actinomycetota bacterium]|nr:SDR family NAD(P)-dependent oxidoreductase [Actinomycetota bacterium]